MLYQHQHFGISEYFCKEEGENFNFPKHLHRSFELITVTSGEMEVTVAEKSYRLTDGESVLIFPNQLHSLKSDRSTHTLVIFSPSVVNSYYSRYMGSRPVNNKTVFPPELLALLHSLERDSSVIKMKALLYFLCDRFDEVSEYEVVGNAENELLSKIFTFVDANFSSDCSLSRLAASLGYNGAYLSRYFKEMTDMSYVSYVNHYKISKACYDISVCDKSILSCSLDCGYSSLRSFNRNFKLLVGVSPSEFRESCKNNGSDR